MQAWILLFDFLRYEIWLRFFQIFQALVNEGFFIINLLFFIFEVEISEVKKLKCDLG